MVVVDIRNFFIVRNVELIEATDDFIYYAEEKNEEGHNNLFLLEYNRKSGVERLITNYSLDDPTFVQHIFSVNEHILIIMENGSNSVWIIAVDKNSGEETSRNQIHCIGRFFDCKVLDQFHVLIYTVETEESVDIFRGYKEITGSTCIVYMYDLENNKKYFVKNNLIGKIMADGLKVFDNHSGRQLILLDQYGDASLKEKCYNESRWISIDIKDNVWTCSLEDFINGVKSQSDKINLKNIFTAGIDGMARFISMDDNYVYFRVHHFPTGSEKICCYDKNSSDISTVCELDKLDTNSNEYYHIDSNAAKIYKIKNNGDYTDIVGILNSNINASYESRFGSLLGCVENRFIICKKEMYDSSEGYRYEYITIYDSELSTEETFDCKCSIKNNTVILY